MVVTLVCCIVITCVIQVPDGSHIGMLHSDHCVIQVPDGSHIGMLHSDHCVIQVPDGSHIGMHSA